MSESKAMISEGSNGKKKGTGRKKMKMEKIRSETNLQVTFSKRKQGLFKKASELAILTGAETAVVVFSPADKPHSFGHPDVHTVINRFLSRNSSSKKAGVGDWVVTAGQNAVVHHRNEELNSIGAQLEKEKKIKQELERVKRVGEEEGINPIINKLSLVKLEQLSHSLTHFKDKLELRIQHITLPTKPSILDQGTSLSVHPENGFSWRMDDADLNLGCSLESNATTASLSHLYSAYQAMAGPSAGGGSPSNRLAIAFPARFGSYNSSFFDPFNVMVGTLGFRSQFSDREAGGASAELPDLDFPSSKFI